MNTGEQFPSDPSSEKQQNIFHVWQSWNANLSKVKSPPLAHAACHLLITLHSSQTPPPSTNHPTSIALHHPPVKTRPRRVKSAAIGARSVCAEQPKWVEFSHGWPKERQCEMKSGIIWWWFIWLQSWFKHFPIMRSLLCLCSKCETKGIKLLCRGASWVLQPKLFTLFSVFLPLVNSNQAHYSFCLKPGTEHYGLHVNATDVMCSQIKRRLDLSKDMISLLFPAFAHKVE